MSNEIRIDPDQPDKPQKPDQAATPPAKPYTPPAFQSAPAQKMHPVLKAIFVIFAVIGVGVLGIFVLGGMVLATCMLGGR